MAEGRGAERDRGSGIFSRDYLLERPLLQRDHAADKAARAADRRDRPRGRRVRGLPARAALGLPGHDPELGTIKRRAPAARRAHLEPHARAGRRAAPAVPATSTSSTRTSEKEVAHHPDAPARSERAAGARGRAVPAGPARRARCVKPPGVAETLDWTQALVTLRRGSLDEDVVTQTLGCLLKDQARPARP